MGASSKTSSAHRTSPRGLERRILQRLGLEKPKRRVGVTLAVAASIVVAAVTAGGMYLASSAHRRLAAHYSQTLEPADGKFFGAIPLRQQDGATVGHVYVYRGSPSWLFMSFSSSDESEAYGVELVTPEGLRSRLGSFRIVEGRGGWGRPSGATSRRWPRFGCWNGPS